MATEAQCERALEANEDRLGSLPNVVGLGIVQEDEDDPTSHGLAVAVYVTKKVPKGELKPEERVPPTLIIPSRYEGDRSRQVPVRVIEQGEVELESFDLETPGG